MKKYWVLVASLVAAVFLTGASIAGYNIVQVAQYTDSSDTAVATDLALTVTPLNTAGYSSVEVWTDVQRTSTFGTYTVTIQPRFGAILGRYVTYGSSYQFTTTSNVISYTTLTPVGVYFSPWITVTDNTTATGSIKVIVRAINQ